MQDKYVVYCTESYYAGQGHSFEKGDIRVTTGTMEEAEHVAQHMNAGWGKGHWAITTYEDWNVNHRDPEFTKKSLARIEKAQAQWRGCVKPHDFQKSDEPDEWGSKTNWQCSKCGFFLDSNTASWYMSGREEERASTGAQYERLKNKIEHVIHCDRLAYNCLTAAEAERMERLEGDSVMVIDLLYGLGVIDSDQI